MPSIRPSSDLRNKYNEISEFCHKYSEPVFITKNGQGDLAVMSIETFERSDYTPQHPCQYFSAFDKAQVPIQEHRRQVSRGM